MRPSHILNYFVFKVENDIRILLKILCTPILELYINAWFIGGNKLAHVWCLADIQLKSIEVECQKRMRFKKPLAIATELSKPEMMPNYYMVFLYIFIVQPDLSLVHDDLMSYQPPNTAPSRYHMSYYRLKFTVALNLLITLTKPIRYGTTQCGTQRMLMITDIETFIKSSNQFLTAWYGDHLACII